MKRLALVSAQQRSELFAATASQMGITPAAVEKDFWIVWVLARLFEHAKWGQLLRFKGGTSLSKAYGVIERFSEDIDLILDWSGLSADNPTAQRSKTSQQKLNTKINQAAQALIAEQLLPDLQSSFSPVCTVALDDQDPHTLNVFYPAVFAAGYLRPVIRLEIGPLAAMLPMQHCMIESYAASKFAQVFSQPGVQVPTIKLERSFWEKLTILHAEAHRPANKPLPSRYARHYYDVWCLAQHSAIDAFIQNAGLLAEVVQFKQQFYPVGWASYNTATPAQIRLLPAPEHLDLLKKDYQAMQEMLFGETPDFITLMNDLQKLQNTINTV